MFDGETGSDNLSDNFFQWFMFESTSWETFKVGLSPSKKTVLFASLKTFYE